MEHSYTWSNLPSKKILIAIVNGLSCIDDYFRFTAVCKSWNSVAQYYKPLLPPKYPLLLLAEDVVPGSIISDGEFDSDSSYSSDGIEYYDEDEDENEDKDDGDDGNHAAADDDAGNGHGHDDNDHIDDDDNDDVAADDDEDEDTNNKSDAADDDAGNGGGDYDNDEADDDDDEDEDEDTNNDSDSNDSDDSEAKKHVCPYHVYDHRNNSIGNSRGLYSLSTGKTYNLELPEASGRLIFGANHGWLLTLGRDLQIHLLHPLLRYKIQLPPMLTLPNQFNYDENHTPEERFDMFFHKAILSSKVPKKDGVNLHCPSSPVVMVSYGPCQMHLAIYRFGDSKWTHVDIQSRPTDDFVYHKGRFFTVNNGGEVYVCDFQNSEGPRATKIAGLPYETFQDRKYLVESISGTLFLLVHNCKKKNFYPRLRRTKYRTTNFLVWKVELQYSDDPLQIPTCTLVEENNLGNQAIFVGRGSSVSVPPSETIRPNCIYFTDDRDDCYFRRGGGHDMGIFNMEDHTIEPHFPGKSLHFISPPLWYI